MTMMIFSFRISGWGKRRDLGADDDYEELPPYHPYALHDNPARTWFDEN